MKNLIIYTVLALLFTVKSFPQNQIAEVLSSGFLCASGTHFTTPPTDPNWSNVTGNSFARAKYDRFNGQTFITLIAYYKEMEVALDYDVKVEKGQLRMTVVNSNDEIVFEKTFFQSEQGQAKVTLAVYDEYKIKFTGTEAKGSYACEWAGANTNNNLSYTN